MNRRLAIVLIIALAVLHGATHVRPYDDIESEVYYGLAKFFSGEMSLDQLKELAGGIVHFLLRPLTPFLAAAFYPFVGMELAFVLLNLIFLVLGTLFVYKLTEAFAGWAAAFSAAVLFPSLPVILYYAVGSRVDMSGFMFAPLLAYLILFRMGEWRSIIKYVALGLLLGIGLLARESNVFTVLLLLTFLLWKKLTPKNFLAILLSAAALLIMWMGVAGLTYTITFKELMITHGGYEGLLKNPVLFLKSFAGFSMPALLLAILGFLSVDSDGTKKVYMLILSTLIPLIPLPQVPDVRVTFTMFPALVPLVGIGLVRLASSLASKPVLSFIGERGWLVILLITILAYNNYMALQWFRLIPF
ncbi:MAG: glycosyltransferase family 39 protein [Nitrososphaerota archaeon]